MGLDAYVEGRREDAFMAQFVVMPKAGNSVESCILLSW